MRDRKIRDIIVALLIERIIFYYFNNILKQYLKINEIAKILLIPKKTLDNYWIKIKYGMKYKFDFDNNMENSI